MVTLTTLLPPLSSQSELTLLSSTLFSVGLLPQQTMSEDRCWAVPAGSRTGSGFQFSTSEFRPSDGRAGTLAATDSRAGRARGLTPTMMMTATGTRAQACRTSDKHPRPAIKKADSFLTLLHWCVVLLVTLRNISFVKKTFCGRGKYTAELTNSITQCQWFDSNLCDQL